MVEQRERAGKLKLRDLAEYFHLPISAASKEMNICASAIKKICRKEGLSRWPHRKVPYPLFLIFGNVCVALFSQRLYDCISVF